MHANTANTATTSTTTTERFADFAAEIDTVKVRAQAAVGNDDVRHVQRLQRFSRGMEVAGRTLIHFSPEPISFALGVTCLWIHKQLQATEIGHTALHGAYDKLEGAEAFASKTYKWDAPIDEASWRYGHNVLHHGNTNVVGKDPDVHFGHVRLSDQVPHAPKHKTQLAYALLVLFPNFAGLMNLHFTGVYDALFGHDGPGGLDFLPDRSWASKRKAFGQALRKYVPYYAKNYLFFPALAGPMFWKVLLGNWMAETMRDVYSAATIFCGHVGAEVAAYPAGSRAKSRGEWYKMQIEATSNFEVPGVLSILCGGLDKQIEHHLFPTLPPQRLREIAPEIAAICARHGVRYRSASWATTLKGALTHIGHLAREGGVRGVLQEIA
jgi:NADPH-dependent stearoyl-CoA 9-desaturase